jgi:hypothetical protein
MIGAQNVLTMNKSNQKHPGKASLEKLSTTSVSANHFPTTNSTLPYKSKDNPDRDQCPNQENQDVWTIKIFLN